MVSPSEILVQLNSKKVEGLALMNGNSITFLFELSNKDYRQTSFSLQGSKRAMTTAFGEKVSVSESP